MWKVKICLFNKPLQVSWVFRREHALVLVVIQWRFGVVCMFLMRPESAEQGSFSNLYYSNLCMSVAVGVMCFLLWVVSFSLILLSRTAETVCTCLINAESKLLHSAPSPLTLQTEKIHFKHREMREVTTRGLFLSRAFQSAKTLTTQSVGQ